MDGKARQLNAQVEALEGQLEAARSAERDAVERLQSFEAMGKQGDERSQAWRRSEDRYVSEASLREQLSEVRKRLADAEAELVTKQAGALELQFENTRLQSDVDRLQRRVEELSSVKVRARAAGRSCALPVPKPPLTCCPCHVPRAGALVASARCRRVCGRHAAGAWP